MVKFRCGVVVVRGLKIKVKMQSHSGAQDDTVVSTVIVSGLRSPGKGRLREGVLEVARNVDNSSGGDSQAV